MIEIFLLLILLSLKHFIIDFPLQYQYMIDEKGTYGAAGGIHHSALHGLGTAAVLTIVGLPDALFLGFVDFVLHYHIDWAKQKLAKGLTPKDKKFWTYLGLDQTLHYLTYFIITFLALL